MEHIRAELMNPAFVTRVTTTQTYSVIRNTENKQLGCVCRKPLFGLPVQRKCFILLIWGAETPSPHPIIHGQQTKSHFGKQVQTILTLLL